MFLVHFLFLEKCTTVPMCLPTASALNLGLIVIPYPPLSASLSNGQISDVTEDNANAKNSPSRRSRDHARHTADTGVRALCF
ncbi:hypothetical protein BDV59DRAFT_170349 [Aspergillus ambiguus]|uniref:uncharacterized protein n=1 Tax=Aspergillus ambiguus TaxID=176160 RepID=UPI003CCD5EA2